VVGAVAGRGGKAGMGNGEWGCGALLQGGAGSKFKRQKGWVERTRPRIASNAHLPIPHSPFPAPDLTPIELRPTAPVTMPGHDAACPPARIHPDRDRRRVLHP